MFFYQNDKAHTFHNFQYRIETLSTEVLTSCYCLFVMQTGAHLNSLVKPIPTCQFNADIKTVEIKKKQLYVLLLTSLLFSQSRSTIDRLTAVRKSGIDFKTDYIKNRRNSPCIHMLVAFIGMCKELKLPILF